MYSIPSGTVRWWWEAPPEEAHHAVMQYVSSVEAAQSDIYERFLRLATLYDPHERMGLRNSLLSFPGADAQVSENVIASNVDTVTALIARIKPRIRYMTDGGDWSTQRRAIHLEWYTNGLHEKLQTYQKLRKAFKDAAIFGTGGLKVCTVGNEIRLERVLIDEIIVDEGECRSTAPRQMHQRKFVDRAELIGMFPEHKDKIIHAHEDAHLLGRGHGLWRWADYRPLDRDQIVVLESWKLPTKGSPGRHVICIDGADLEDEEWTHDHFPFAFFRWNERLTGFYGRGLAEEIAGHQRMLNKLNWQTDRQLDQLAVPTTYVRLADANLAVKTTNRIGAIVPYKSDKPPETVIPKAVSPEVYQRHEAIKESAYEFAGVNRQAAMNQLRHNRMDSAPALEVYRNITTERFAIQEQMFEEFAMDVSWLVVEAAKSLGESAPAVYKRTRWGEKKIEWKDVDMGEVRVQMQVASPIAHTPAGRTRTVIEWLQAGIIEKEDARMLLQHPDLERAMSLYNAALEDIERTIEEILDGEELVPEPFQNLKMGIWRMQAAYLKAKADGAPDEILENLSIWIEMAAWIESQAQMSPPSGGMPMAPGEMGPPGPSGEQGPMPSEDMSGDPGMGPGGPPMPGGPMPGGPPPGMPPQPM